MFRSFKRIQLSTAIKHHSGLRESNSSRMMMCLSFTCSRPLALECCRSRTLRALSTWHLKSFVKGWTSSTPSMMTLSRLTSMLWACKVTNSSSRSLSISQPFSLANSNKGRSLCTLTTTQPSLLTTSSRWESATASERPRSDKRASKSCLSSIRGSVTLSEPTILFCTSSFWTVSIYLVLLFWFWLFYF